MGYAITASTKQFRDEQRAIRQLRDSNPVLSAHRLARKIMAKDFPIGTEDFNLACHSGYPQRTYYSLLSVIRRYDAKLALPAIKRAA